MRTFFDKLFLDILFLITEFEINKKSNDKNFFATKQLGWHISKLTKPFFNKQGFTKSYVIDNWKEIVGEKYYKITTPEKIRIQKGGGILTIATDGATATEMEFIKSDIIKKVNEYYEFRAIDRIRFRNSYLNVSEKKESIQEKVKLDDKKDKKNISDLLSDIEDGELKERISSLGKYIFNK